MPDRIIIVAPVIVLVLAVNLLLCGPPSSEARTGELTGAEVVARHLESLGRVQARKAATSRLVSGSVIFRNRFGAGIVQGPASLISEGKRILYTMRFPTISDLIEETLFDGSRTRTSVRPGGGRSPLNRFLEIRNVPLKEGLLGGVLTTSWPLLDLAKNRPKLEYKGQHNASGRRMHKVAYKPRKGSQGVTINLYFDPETYRHVLSVYEFEIGATIGIRDTDSAVNTESSYKLSEEFGDFEDVDGLTLPHNYRIQVATRVTARNALTDWELIVDEIVHNKAFGPDRFRLQ